MLFTKIILGVKFTIAHLTDKRIPLTASLHITNRCNFNCGYCDIHSRSKEEMGTNQIIRMINQFSEMGVKKLGISGGEPLIRDDIGKIVNHAKKKGLITSITTNGSLIRGKLNEIKKIDLILISYDGELSKHLRNAKHDALSNIIFAVRNKMKVWSITVLTKDSIKNLDQLFRDSEKYGFKLLFQPLNLDYSLNKKKRGTDNEISQEDLIKAINKIIYAKKRGIPIANSYPYLKLLRSGFRNSSKNCMAGKRYFNIDANGLVYPCGVLFEQMNAMNGDKQGYFEAFKNIPLTFSCPGCHFPCYLEEDLIFKLNPSAIINALRNKV